MGVVGCGKKQKEQGKVSRERGHGRFRLRLATESEAEGGVTVLLNNFICSATKPAVLVVGLMCAGGCPCWLYTVAVCMGLRDETKRRARLMGR